MWCAGRTTPGDADRERWAKPVPLDGFPVCRSITACGARCHSRFAGPDVVPGKPQVVDRVAACILVHPSVSAFRAIHTMSVLLSTSGPRKKSA